uniref:Uncharacterized protein n=1 Tax=Arion vulgaris TaxID=1028688 RepID=A0A0B6ZC34_9EUPU
MGQKNGGQQAIYTDTADFINICLCMILAMQWEAPGKVTNLCWWERKQNMFR